MLFTYKPTAHIYISESSWLCGHSSSSERKRAMATLETFPPSSRDFATLCCIGAFGASSLISCLLNTGFEDGVLKAKCNLLAINVWRRLAKRKWEPREIREAPQSNCDFNEEDYRSVDRLRHQHKLLQVAVVHLAQYFYLQNQIMMLDFWKLKIRTCLVIKKKWEEYQDILRQGL